MAGQGPSRRELLEALSLASAACAFGGFARWSYGLSAGQPQHASAAHRPVHPAYHPQFFSLEQYRSVVLLAELILPAARGATGKHQPGATDAGVAEFIDFMVASDTTLQPSFHQGLAWLDTASTPAASFLTLQRSSQTALLERLAYRAKYRQGDEPGQEFFRLMRKYTVIGFYTTRLGLESLDYPGLTFYGTSPGCTHDGNPEHAGL